MRFFGHFLGGLSTEARGCAGSEWDSGSALRCSLTLGLAFPRAGHVLGD